MKRLNLIIRISAASFWLASCGAEPPEVPSVSAVDDGNINGENPGGPGNNQNPDGSGTVLPLRLTTEPVAPSHVYCPEGGTHIMWYADVNKDNALDSKDFIRQSTFLCYGQGTNQVTEEVPNPDLSVIEENAPAGTGDCKNSGSNKTVVIDKDKDSRKGKGDIAETLTLCNNSKSKFALSGFELKTEQRAVGKGHSQCSLGGVEHIVFADRDISGNFSKADSLVSVSFLCTLGDAVSHEAFGQVVTSLTAGDSTCSADGVEVVAFIDTDNDTVFSDKDDKYAETLCANLPGPKPVAFHVSAVSKNKMKVRINLAGSDPSGKKIIDYKITSTVPPSQGTLTVKGTPPTVDFEPNNNFDGVATFTYRAVNEEYAVSEDAVATVYVKKPRALFITSQIPGTVILRQSDDDDIEDRLIDMGLGGRIYYGTNNVTANEAEGYDLVIISGYAYSQDLLAGAKVPILTLSSQHYSRLNLAPGEIVDNMTQFTITTPNHPLAGLLSGTAAPFRNLTGLSFPKSLDPAAQVMANVAGKPNDAALFLFESGAKLLDGTNLPARRIGLAQPYDPDPASGSYFRFTPDGLNLLEAAILQALARNTP
ncbi:MAG: Ig-like domain-containing protein [Oligoflexales bacterium]